MNSVLLQWKVVGKNVHWKPATREDATRVTMNSKLGWKVGETTIANYCPEVKKKKLILSFCRYSSIHNPVTSAVWATAQRYSRTEHCFEIPAKHARFLCDRLSVRSLDHWISRVLFCSRRCCVCTCMHAMAEKRGAARTHSCLCFINPRTKVFLLWPKRHLKVSQKATGGSSWHWGWWPGKWSFSVSGKW
jgi:hypothetical protein